MSHPIYRAEKHGLHKSLRDRAAIKEIRKFANGQKLHTFRFISSPYPPLLRRYEAAHRVGKNQLDRGEFTDMYVAL